MITKNERGKTMNAIYQTLNPNNTIVVNRPLAHAIGLSEAIVYATLISKYYYYAEREMLDADGWFFSTVPDLEESTALSDKQQKRCIDKLVKIGLIKCVMKGMPAKRSFYIVEDIEMLQQLIGEGEAIIKDIKPSAAAGYERKRKSAESSEPDTETAETPSETALQPCSAERAASGRCEAEAQSAARTPHNIASAEQAPTNLLSLLRQNSGASSAQTEDKSNIIKTNIIKSNINQSNQSIPHPEQQEEAAPEQPDMMDMIDTYTQIVEDNISYETLAEQNQSDKPYLEEIKTIIVDTICSNAKTIRINQTDMPQEVVKSRFLHLNDSHIGYVLSCLKKNTTQVRNIRAYLLTSLYNSLSTMSSYYQAEVNHDVFGG